MENTSFLGWFSFTFYSSTSAYLVQLWRYNISMVQLNSAGNVNIKQNIIKYIRNLDLSYSFIPRCWIYPDGCRTKFDIYIYSHGTIVWNVYSEKHLLIIFDIHSNLPIFTWDALFWSPSKNKNLQVSKKMSHANWENSQFF